MQVLPNGVNIFNATADTLVFYRHDWLAPFRVSVDFPIKVRKKLQKVGEYPNAFCDYGYYVTVKEVYEAKYLEVLDRVLDGVVIVGSLEAARAYPGRVVAPIPYLGYEDATPMEMRYQADVFMVF